MKLRWPLRLGLVRLSILAVVVGLVTGLGAVVFRDLIGIIHNVMFLGIRRPLRRKRVHAAEPLGPVGHSGAGDRRGASPSS